MKIDVLRLLELDYVNMLISQLNNEVVNINNSFLVQYKIEDLHDMNVEDVNALFEPYDISNDNVIQFLESNFIDEDWEFSDLFGEDIRYSKEKKESMKNEALKELERLNNQIRTINEEYQKKINELEVVLKLMNTIADILKGNVTMTKGDIIKLQELVITADYINKEEKFKLSDLLVRYLIEKNLALSLENTSVVDTSQFEKELDNIYENVEYKDELLDITIEEPSYSETILSYYEAYKALFNEVKLGGSLTEVLEVAHDLSQGINASIDTISKDDFCVELAALLYQLNNEYKKANPNQEIISNILLDLTILDRLYDRDVELKPLKIGLLEKINTDMAVISMLNLGGDLATKTVNRLKLLKMELTQNLISDARTNYLDEEYKNVKKDIVKVSQMSKNKDTLLRLSSKINKLFHELSNKQYVTDSYYLGLTDLQSRIMVLLDRLEQDFDNSKVMSQIAEFEEEFSRYGEKTSKKTQLKGFVLFDFDLNNRAYVLNDLDYKNKNCFIGDSFEGNKVVSAYEQYNVLIDDLFRLGESGILNNGDNTDAAQILDYVYLDPKERKHPTKMVRIRPLTKSLVRFVGQNLILSPDSLAYKQVVGIIQEILPNVQIKQDEEFVLYINYASSLISNPDDMYSQAINRYNKMSPIHKLFINIHENKELTEKECILLKDFIHMSLDTYSELVNKNENLKFEVINQMGGMKTRV